MDCLGKGFFNIHMFAGTHKGCCDRSMIMVRSTDKHSIDRFFLFKHLTPVVVDLCLWISFEDVSGIIGIYIAQGIDVGKLDNITCSCITHLYGSICVGFSLRTSSLGLHSFPHSCHPGFPGSNLFLGHRGSVHIPHRPLYWHIRSTDLLDVTTTLTAHTNTSHINQITWCCVTLTTQYRTWNNSKSSCSRSSGT